MNEPMNGPMNGPMDQMGEWMALDRGIKRLTPNSFFMFITACERSGNLNAAVEAAEQHNVLGFTLYKSSLKQGRPVPRALACIILSVSVSLSLSLCLCLCLSRLFCSTHPYTLKAQDWLTRGGGIDVVPRGRTFGLRTLGYQRLFGGEKNKMKMIYVT